MLSILFPFILWLTLRSLLMKQNCYVFKFYVDWLNKTWWWYDEMFKIFYNLWVTWSWNRLVHSQDFTTYVMKFENSVIDISSLFVYFWDSKFGIVWEIKYIYLNEVINQDSKTFLRASDQKNSKICTFLKFFAANLNF